MKKIMAVVVTYNPDLARLKSLLSVLSKSVSGIVLVDNASKNQALIKETFAEFAVMALASNKGIASAQNCGIKKALAFGCDGIVFFDQDSEVNSDLIARLAETFRVLAVSQNIAIIGPIHKDRRVAFFYPLIRISKSGWVRKIDPAVLTGPTKVDLVISSGSLVSTQALLDVGFMNEDFFIDYVDTEWCLRAKKKGYELYVDPRCILVHEIGESILKLWRWYVPVHSPSRRYYRIRNGYRLLKIDYFPALLCTKEIVQNMLHQIFLMLISDRRWDYAKYAWKGTRDGICEIWKRS